MNKILTGFACGALCCVPVFAQTSSNGAATGGAAAGSTAAGAPSDSEFVMMAGQDDMTEAHVGQLAQDQASGQEVKDYGQMLTQDHTKNYDALTAAATKAGATVPKAIDEQHIKMMAPLTKLKGRAFDHRFLEMAVQDHKKAIAMYQKEADNGTNPALKEYASATLPTLQMHLQKAEDLMRPAAGHGATGHKKQSTM